MTSLYEMLQSDMYFVYNMVIIWLIETTTARTTWVRWTVCKQSAPRSRQITRPTPHHLLIFTDQMLFLTPNQQCQSTGGIWLMET